MTLVYLANSFMFVGSHYGDSQLVRLPSTHSGSGPIAQEDEDMEIDTSHTVCCDGRLQVVNSFTNLAPILDFVIVETDAFGSVRLAYFHVFHDLGSTDLEWPRDRVR
jgi:DNA damage-binding protein 1